MIETEVLEVAEDPTLLAELEQFEADYESELKEVELEVDQEDEPEAFGIYSLLSI